MSDVPSVTTTANAHLALDQSDGTGEAPYVPRDPFAELAELIVQNDFLRADLDAQNLRAAREAEARARREEVSAMRRGADAIVVQAYVQGGMAALGGLAQCAGSLGQVGNTPPAPDAGHAERCDFRRCELELKGLDKAGGALGSIAQPLGQLTGGVEKAHADADAAEARNEAEQAEFEKNEAQAHFERLSKHTDSVLELVESTLDSEHQGNLAILARF
ncbi:MAG TPA: hypothetical protein VFV94_02565 [Polyangiaceae bacterium]|nr:hypothetical protein [Polyangiaceae bacterium]